MQRQITQEEFIDNIQHTALSQCGSCVIATKTDAKILFKAILAQISEALVNGDTVSLRGVGKLRVVRQVAQKRRNPQTGIIEVVPEKKRVLFKASKTIREKVNQ